MSDNARELALLDFGVERFVKNCNAVFAELTQEVVGYPLSCVRPP